MKLKLIVIYKDGKLILKEIERKFKYLKPIKEVLYLKKDFLTMVVLLGLFTQLPVAATATSNQLKHRLETITTKGIMSPVCISIYDGMASLVVSSPKPRPKASNNLPRLS
jgi:hypothetical protein